MLQVPAERKNLNNNPQVSRSIKRPAFLLAKSQYKLCRAPGDFRLGGHYESPRLQFSKMV